MNRLFVIIILSFFCIVNTLANISPNPIKAKGIMAFEKTAIQMVSERIEVDLYMDSSVVECHFIMKNLGDKQLVSIGFPQMSFHHFRISHINDFGNYFQVFENHKQIQLFDIYTPNPNLSEAHTLSSLEGSFENEEQPWYLWNSEFEEGETKLVRVRYSLPYGVIKRDSRYFTYVVNTGSGWKGSIEDAEIAVNIKDFSKDLILEIEPENYSIEENRIVWRFQDFNPTLANDIKIFYEPYQGYRESARIEPPKPTYVLYDPSTPNGAVFKDWKNLDFISPNEIISIKILKDSTETRRFTSDKDGVVLIYTKGFAVDKLNRLIQKTSSSMHRLAYDSSLEFLERYELLIDESSYKNSHLLQMVVDLIEADVKRVNVSEDPLDKIQIQIEMLD